MTLNWLLVFLSHVNKNIIHSFIHSFKAKNLIVKNNDLPVKTKTNDLPVKNKAKNLIVKTKDLLVKTKANDLPIKNKAKNLLVKTNANDLLVEAKYVKLVASSLEVRAIVKPKRLCRRSAKLRKLQ